jgi:hypothetical protein
VDASPPGVHQRQAGSGLAAELQPLGGGLFDDEPVRIRSSLLCRAHAPWAGGSREGWADAGRFAAPRRRARSLLPTFTVMCLAVAPALKQAACHGQAW